MAVAAEKLFDWFVFHDYSLVGPDGGLWAAVR
jgi:hypothetical protein